MIHVRQRGNYDCGIAVISSYLEVEYETAEELFSFRPDDIDQYGNVAGISETEISYILNSLGHCNISIYTKSNMIAFGDKEHEERWKKSVLPTADFLKRKIIDENLTAIVSVDSWQYKNGLHLIGVKDGKVFDPSTDIGKVSIELYVFYHALIFTAS